MVNGASAKHRQGKDFVTNTFRGQKPSSSQGPLHPNWKHGRYSKHIPPRLAATYNSHFNDPEYLAQDAEIATLSTRLSELFGQIETGESGALWKALQHAVSEFRKYSALKKKPEAELWLNEIISLVERGNQEQLVWDEIRGVIIDRNKIVTSERKRLIEAEAYFTAEQGMAMLMRVADAVKRHVPDEKAKRAIAYEISLLMNFQGATVDVSPEP
jgi:hypothetical protein